MQLRLIESRKEDNVAQEDEHLRAYREINEGYDRLS